MKLQEEKFKSWQNYCSTEESNPWNAIYKTASGKLRGTTCLTTLQQPDGSFTADTESTVKHMLHYFALEDNEANDSAEHRLIRKLTKEPMGTGDDKPFTQEDVASVIKKLKLKRPLGRTD